MRSPCSFKVATVLTVYGIETENIFTLPFSYEIVATVLTVYGIETIEPENNTFKVLRCNSAYRLRY